MSNMHSVNTGLTEGDFHTLRVLRNGAMTDILGIITAMVAAGAGITTLTAGSGIQVTGSGNTRTIAATGGAGTILQLNSTTQNATTLNFVGQIGTLVGNVLSIAPQPLINSTMNLHMQDLTCRFLAGGNATSAFSITGHTLINLMDAAGNTLGSEPYPLKAGRAPLSKMKASATASN